MTIPVELLGGPLDGHQCHVAVTDPARNVWLFRDLSGPEPKEVHAYAFHGTSTPTGSHWILRHLYRVAWSPKPKPTA